MPIKPAALWARFVPRRSPPFHRALAVSLGAMAVAAVLRGAFLGWDGALGLSTAQFPAFILATLYAGQRWGWATLAAVVALSFTVDTILAETISRQAALVLFLISAAVTVLVAGALRENLLRLGEAQAALDASEAHLQTAQNAGGVGPWSWDVDQDVGRWSPTLYKNLGLDPSTRPTIRALLEVIHPEDRERVRQNNVRALKTGRMDPVEYRVVHPDGQVRWLLSRGDVQVDETGRARHAVGVNIDVTDRHVAEEQVRESEARFRALADSAPVLMWVSRSDGKREFANRAYVDFLGEPYETAIAFDWRKRLHPDDLDRILAEQIAGESSRKLFELEARYLRADGQWRWVRSISQPRYDPLGAFIGFIGIGFDVTEAKQAQADLQRINDLLAERVQAALAERDEAEAALRHAQKLEAVGQLTGGVAHDFNNLLTVVIGALDLIQRHPADAARRDRMIEAALGAARRGERLTQQLLAFSRRQALNPQPVRVDELVAEAEPLLRRAVGEAVAFSVRPSAEGATAMVDPGQFEAALMNLVVNARDATAHGGAIRIETAACELAEGQVPETAPGAYVRLCVHDTGVGMAPEVMARVFEPFFTTKEVGKGTGLGLSQVYGFVRQSGGGVAIESAPGRGATVRLYLPRVQDSAPLAEPSRAPTAPASNASLKVLLVEDDPDVGDMIAAMLEELGHKVLRASGVTPALEILRGGEALDLLLTDLIMPGDKTGVDLAREAVAMRPGLPVILSSGYTGESLGPAEETPWPLLRKPYSAEALAQTIERAVEAG
ncbi:MAG: PAS domain-containing protein [Phenylobacterium sp.]|uniref:hybrid sensor histidine kinase/response regulator n=1 Tax=Phenylobacterium sp. TaxID=1871053 RepID=UPI00391B19DF